MNLHRRELVAALAAFSVAPALAQSETGKSAPLARRLADYAAGLRFADLDAATVERAKVHLLDSLGCGIAAFAEGPVSAVRNLALASGGNAATILGTRKRAAIEWATFANGCAIRADDINDVYAGKETGHPSDNLAACLAAAEAEHASGADVLTAMVLAYEIECRFLDAAFLTERGWDHPSDALISGVLAAGKLMKLAPPQLEQAVNLGIVGHLALDQTRLGVLSNWKGMAGPEAARSAVFAAELAKAGITGPTPIFEGDAGFFKLVSGPLAIDPDTFGGRGKAFKILDCFIKSYPAQAQTQTAILAAANVGKKVGDVSRIRAIEIRTTHLGWLAAGSTPERFAPQTSETADHSLPYIVARAMLDGNITAKSYTPESLRDPRVATLLKLIKVTDDARLTALTPRQSPNAVIATLADGSTVAERVDDLPGFITRPMQRADAEAKFARNVKGVMTEAQVARTADTVWALDRAENVAALIDSVVIG